MTMGSVHAENRDLALGKPRFRRADLFAFNPVWKTASGDCRAASLRLYGRSARQRAVGPPVPALPFQPAKHIARPCGEPCWHRPDRSSGRLLRNKAAPWHEDALGPTWDFQSLSGLESNPPLIAKERLPWPDMEQTFWLVYGSIHFRVNAAGSGIYVWMGQAAPSPPTSGQVYCRVQAGGLAALIRRASLTSSLTAPVIGSARPAASAMPPTICISFNAQVKLV